jgi:CDP-diacylglycerol pyrophosphatase
MGLGNLRVALLLCVGSASLFAAADEPDHGRDQLRFIVQQECLPGWLKAHNPDPCISVTLTGHGLRAQGYALLADRRGGAHFLLIPTQSISGIESPALRAPGAINYFDAAWKARQVLDSVVGRAVPRSAVGLGVNSIRARSQDQLHIHISCLSQSVYEALQSAADRIGGTWTPFPMGGFRYQAIRIIGRQLGGPTPFELLADRLPGAKDDMGEFTLLVAGASFKDGPGFVALAGASVPGTRLLLDPSCALVNETADR